MAYRHKSQKKHFYNRRTYTIHVVMHVLQLRSDRLWGVSISVFLSRTTMNTVLVLKLSRNLIFSHLYEAEVVALLTFQVICKNVYNFHWSSLLHWHIVYSLVYCWSHTNHLQFLHSPSSSLDLDFERPNPGAVSRKHFDVLPDIGDSHLEQGWLWGGESSRGVQTSFIITSRHYPTYLH